ncbi:MAG: GNAT family N-acetyltransferase [Acidobacteria bacterium]|nr:GNAT family N-acetyltransferase [Acidobacteriota bacterium]
MEITAVRSEDMEAVKDLLERVELPLEGVAEHFGGFLAAWDGDRVVGCIGLERYGEWGLLRSLAVAPERQGEGIGAALTARLLEDAARDGVSQVVLLTTTASEFFARRFGFEAAERSAFDTVFAESREWKLPRCSSAACLRLTLPSR